MLDSLYSLPPEAGLAALFVAAFVSGTLLPGGSELLLVALIAGRPEQTWAAVAVAAAGNALGGATSYAIGRLLPNRASPAAVERLRRYGPAALLFTWLPVIGDALCVAAGWLRLDARPALLLIALGKLLRYAAVAGGWAWLGQLLAFLPHAA